MNISFLIAILAGLLLQSDNASVTLRGRVVKVEQGFLFKTTGEKTHPLVRTITSESLFVDPHMRELDLEVTGRIHAKDGSLEVIQIRSIHNGVLHDAFYWCETCRIRSTAPGPCWCCFQPFEFREVPIKE